MRGIPKSDFIQKNVTFLTAHTFLDNVTRILMKTNVKFDKTHKFMVVAFKCNDALNASIVITARYTL